MAVFWLLLGLAFYVVFACLVGRLLGLADASRGDSVADEQRVENGDLVSEAA